MLSRLGQAMGTQRARDYDPPDDCAWYRFCEAEASDAPPRLHLSVRAERAPSPQGQLALA